MFFVTGDTHGEWNRLGFENFPQGRELTKNDYVFIMGDFGIWDNSARERQQLDWLSKKPFQICFISGNHENYDMLDKMPVEEWCGGMVNFIRDNIIHLRRGQVYTIDGVKIFTFGGAKSHDIQHGILDRTDDEFAKKRKILNQARGMYRINHESWWQQELPSMEEMKEGILNLIKHDWKVDYIFTHCTATSLQNQLDGTKGLYRQDILTEYLEGIRKRTDYRWWIWGHYHMNCKMNDREVVLYQEIVSIPNSF